MVSYVLFLLSVGDFDNSERYDVFPNNAVHLCGEQKQPESAE